MPANFFKTLDPDAEYSNEWTADQVKWVEYNYDATTLEDILAGANQIPFDQANQTPLEPANQTPPDSANQTPLSLANQAFLSHSNQDQATFQAPETIQALPHISQSENVSRETDYSEKSALLDKVYKDEDKRVVSSQLAPQLAR
jgi:hypothetical protein